jgi:hypothetical protein
MTYERCTVAELVVDVFGTFESCVDEVLISVDLDAQALIPYYGVGELSAIGSDWLSLAFWQVFADED